MHHQQSRITVRGVGVDYFFLTIFLDKNCFFRLKWRHNWRKMPLWTEQHSWVCELCPEKTGGSIACGRTKHSHNTHPVFMVVACLVKQYCCKSASVAVLFTLAQTARPDTTTVQWAWGQDCSGPFPPLHSQILMVVSDKPRSTGVSGGILQDRVWSQNVTI